MLAAIALVATASPARAEVDLPALVHASLHGRSTTLPRPGKPALEVMLGPAASDWVVVYLHGFCGDPFAFRPWASEARRHATFISLRGDLACDDRPGRRKWSWDYRRIDRAIREAVVEVSAIREAAGGAHLSQDRIALIGYSQGAQRVAQLAGRFPDRYRRVVVIAPAKTPSAGLFRKAERILLMGGAWDVRDPLYEARDALLKTRRPVRYLELPKARHGEYGPEGPRVMAEGLAWLFAPLAEAEPAAGTGQAAPSGAHVP
ncbi:MAG: alpha/beta fold hydrolase [Polyangiaceae bacterium]